MPNEKRDGYTCEKNDKPVWSSRTYPTGEYTHFHGPNKQDRCEGKVTDSRPEDQRRRRAKGAVVKVKERKSRPLDASQRRQLKAQEKAYAKIGKSREKVIAKAR